MRRSPILFALGLGVLVGCSQHGTSSPLPAAPQSLAVGSSRWPDTSFDRRPRAGVGFKSLYSFAGAPDGANPLAVLVAVNGTLYSTTYEGGKSGLGTVFKVSASGTERVLHSFTGVAPNGANPSAGLVAVNGALYGTTSLGGKSGDGTVFKVSTSGKQHVLYSFAGAPDGANPYAALVAVNGTLYGTTYEGGKSGNGSVFTVSTSGTERVLYSFKGAQDGANPAAGLTLVNGTLYGTTYRGGTSGNGTVFKVSVSGTEHVIYSFKGAPDGANPYAGLAALNGTLYGTTYEGGKSGNGSVFKVSTSGTERALYSFKGASDGANPYAGLIALNGTLYGATFYGGNSGNGTIFKVSTTGTERVLYRFTGVAPDGANPYASLVSVNGTLYGTTHQGGKSGNGIVFKLTP